MKKGRANEDPTIENLTGSYTEVKTYSSSEAARIAVNAGIGHWMILSRVSVPTIVTTAHLGPSLLLRTCYRCGKVFETPGGVIDHVKLDHRPTRREKLSIIWLRLNRWRYPRKDAWRRYVTRKTQPWWDWALGKPQRRKR
jgi:hypothetical protein